MEPARGRAWYNEILLTLAFQHSVHMKQRIQKAFSSGPAVGIQKRKDTGAVCFTVGVQIAVMSPFLFAVHVRNGVRRLRFYGTAPFFLRFHPVSSGVTFLKGKFRFLHIISGAWSFYSGSDLIEKNFLKP